MVVVTGATGHIGNVLIKNLVANGEKVRVIILKNTPTISIEGFDVERVYGDVRDKSSLEKAFEGAKTVYHLASKISILPYVDKELYSINIDGTKNVADVCLEKNIRLIYVSSVHAIMDKPEGEIDETTPMEEPLIGAYGKTKAKATKYVLSLTKNNGLNAVIVQPSGVVGPYDYLLSSMGWVIHSMARWLFFFVDAQYNFVDVRDVVDGIIRANKYGKSGERYILSGYIVKLKELKKLIDKFLKRPYMFIKMPKFLALLSARIMTPIYKYTKIVPFLTEDSIKILFSNPNIKNDKAKRELSWNIRPFEDTIKDTINWLFLNKNIWKQKTALNQSN